MPPPKKQSALLRPLRVYEFINLAHDGKDDDPFMNYTVLSSDDVAALRQKMKETK